MTEPDTQPKLLAPRARDAFLPCILPCIISRRPRGGQGGGGGGGKSGGAQGGGAGTFPGGGGRVALPQSRRAAALRRSDAQRCPSPRARRLRTAADHRRGERVAGGAERSYRFVSTRRGGARVNPILLLADARLCEPRGEKRGGGGAARSATRASASGGRIARNARARREVDLAIRLDGRAAGSGGNARGWRRRRVRPGKGSQPAR